MKSHATEKFWKLYRDLPPPIRNTAVKQYRRWLLNPRHPSVHFKKIGTFWAARVTDDYRALGIMEADTVIRFWIGGHGEYERLLKK